MKLFFYNTKQKQTNKKIIQNQNKHDRKKPSNNYLCYSNNHQL